ncbi:PREDICTED: transcription factor GLABRA 3-like isoform X2 [Nelumbo nucifera]|uniref:BHLH domain-containing protein n=2 Tax=Nelumbo nucifera TaxID=4432 RepID=A0A822ZR65_NELNU|nr:PREDICTED: transcription factor GLABRA 3-like isoform X2 [Nelumbo nucifera]DAD47363.1 TPA_asm: hypothetical protein HUJ06_017300 [Nelumbo nucifera]
MCWAMGAGLQNQEGVPENHLSKQLAFAVRSIQWSYAIFWSISTRQQGVLEWGDGYYNGNIKTRKTIQHMELNADQMGLRRSEQLRELYESLSAGDTIQQARRPSASLSPEDLTDAEWLPGRALANGQPIWLCNAHYADSKVFSRSLLAKSASIQTVICFPFLGGVVELGVTELVLEDPSLIQHVKTSCLEFPKPICSEQSTSSPQNADNEENPTVKHEVVDSMALDKLNPVSECEVQPEIAPQEALPPSSPNMPKEEIEFEQDGVEELVGVKSGSPDDSSNEYKANQPTEESFMLEGVNAGTSRAHRWQAMDDEFSNCMHGSINLSDSISQTFVNPQKVVSSPKGERTNNLQLQDLQECNHTKLRSLDLGTDDLHYTRTLSAIFKNSHPLNVSPNSFHGGNHESSFKSWVKGGFIDAQKVKIGTPQKILKTILFEVALLHGGSSLKSREEITGKVGICRLEGDYVGMNHVLSERKRREKMNEKFLILRSLVPSISKVDKASILADTIEYLKDLERRIEELESCKELPEFEARTRRKHPDMVERTSDNYGNNDISNGKKPSINKRKASDIDESEPELNQVLSTDCLAADVTVSMIGKEVLIEIRCPWRDCLFLDIMDAVSNLHLDAHTVQSSTVDGILSVTLKSKFRGAAVASAGMVKQALGRVISKG